MMQRITKISIGAVCALLVAVQLLVAPAAADPLFYDYARPAYTSPGQPVTGPDGATWHMTDQGIGWITPTDRFVLRSEGMAAGPDGNFWFYGGSGIYSMTPGGTLTAHTLTPPPGSFSFFADVTAGPDGALWLTNRSTASSSTAGGSIFRLSTTGTVTGQYATPSGVKPWRIIAGPDGNLWFTYFNNDFGVYGIGRITTDGVITTFPNASYPQDIIAGPDGALWVPLYHSDNTGSIARFDISGALTATYAVPTPQTDIQSITVGPDGNMWFTEYHANKVGRITPSGTVTEYTIPTADAYPSAITTGPDNKLWYVQAGTGRIGTIVPPVSTAPPVVTSAQFSTNPKPVSQAAVTLSAAISDPDSAVVSAEYYDPVQQTWAPMNVAGGTATANINTPAATYGPGIYPFQVRAADADGNVSSPITAYLDVYNPAGGYAAGHGVITPNGPTSHPGDTLPPASGGTPKATLDFSVKYDSATATTPTGSSVFTWGVQCNKPSNTCFSVTASTWQWLMVSGDAAVLQGTAAVAVEGQMQGNNYPVRITVSANPLPSVADHYMVQVYAVGADPNTATPLYQASGDLVNGQIVVHN